MSETEDFEWNEICVKIAYEEEKLLKGHGFHEIPSSSNAQTVQNSRLKISRSFQPHPETFGAFNRETEASSTSDKDPSPDSAKLSKGTSDGFTLNQARPTRMVELESVLMKKQGEISILRERLEKLEREKFEAIEACRLLRQDSHKRDSSLPCSSREEINQLHAEVTRLQKLNEFYHQEINSLEVNRKVNSFLQDGSGDKDLPARLDAETTQKNSRNILRGHLTQLTKPGKRVKNVLDEFETVVNELNQHDQSRPVPNSAFGFYDKRRPRQLILDEEIPDKRYSFHTAVSFHIFPEPNTGVTNDMTQDRAEKCLVNTMNLLTGDELMALRRLVLNSEEHLSSNLLRFLNMYSEEDYSVLKDTTPNLLKFIDSLLQILESGYSMTSLEDASRILHSVLLKIKEFCHTLDLSNCISLERILALVQRMMEETIPLKTFFNVIEGTVIILEGFLLQRVSSDDIEIIFRFLRHFSTIQQEEIFLSAHSSLLYMLMLIIDILFTGQEYVKSKQSMYSGYIVQLGTLLLSSSSLCFQRAGIYLGYKLKEVLTCSSEIHDYTSLTEMLICITIREYLMLLQYEYSTYFNQPKLSCISQRQPSWQRIFVEKLGNNRFTMSESVLFFHYSLRTCHFMIYYLKDRNCSLNFLLDYSVPLFSMLKAMFEDRRKALGNLKEAYEISLVICDVIKGIEVNGIIK
ncbi:uncharacterized protein Gasu_05480 [Galdieria sulphuraria]|uniref:Uncharacterized protein n=1 Tax=Galdieria sulphuraria TaxID=130081 RepID=M2W8C7_GALSU|nr:uncharacterized protein Gasu_05480 [Galdieria sulphuraria]EME32131.1 hypothetical protein Gasu_05480 [Galdieria sulphuraria]|eukprot:XP_005708651.1 hypothetical protein Gasu_05480 [Galdieria sulphuraria]